MDREIPLNSTLPISHDLKPEELTMAMTLSQKTNPSIGLWIWEVVRALACLSEALRDESTLQEMKA